MYTKNCWKKETTKTTWPWGTIGVEVENCLSYFLHGMKQCDGIVYNIINQTGNDVFNNTIIMSTPTSRKEVSEVGNHLINNRP